MMPLPHESALQYLARIGKMDGIRELPNVLKLEIQRGIAHHSGLFMVGWKD